MDRLRVLIDPRVPDGEIWIIDTADNVRKTRIFNIRTEYRDYPGADWIHQTGEEDPKVEQTTWQRFSWLTVLGIILFPLLLVILYVVLLIIFSLTS